MEIIIPVQEKNNAISPVSIFKQAWRVCWKNVGKLSAIYLIFNLPVTIISLFPAVRQFADQKPSLAALLWFLFLIVISSWGHVALLLGANKAVSTEDYTIGQSISQSRLFLVKYLALILSVTLFIMVIIIVAGVSVVVALVFLSEINKMLAALICSVLVIVAVSSLVFFLLRWSISVLVCVFENSGPVSALKRSFCLVKEHINPVVGVYGLIMVVGIACLVPIVIAGALSSTGSDLNRAQLGSVIYMVLINAVLVPFFTTMIVVLYRKLREVSEDSCIHATIK
ncbi:MAG: hypothetical protein PHC29_02505 [Candidatus Omnitrophica bacterium]|nr:hypothetical protein [Candidatus Omnitrophota bacterium]